MSWITAVAGAVGTALGAIGTVRDKTQDYWMLRRYKRSKLAQTLSDLRQEEARLRAEMRTTEHDKLIDDMLREAKRRQEQDGK